MPKDTILEIGQAGLEVSEERTKSHMNRLVNSETPGFRGSDPLIQSFPLELESAERKISGMAPVVTGTFYNQTPGTLIKTGNPTDLALGGEGFFVVLGPWGEGFTRDGRFKLDKDGNLLSSAGSFPLLGKSGPISIPAGSEIEITQDGDVKTDGRVVDRIRVVKFDQRELSNLVSLNGSIFNISNPQTVYQTIDSPRIVQGYIESSNVNVISETRDLVIEGRYATGITELIKNRDAALSRLMTIGKPSQ